MTGVIHIVVAMKPLEGNFAENAVKHGVAGLNIDESRVETTENLTARAAQDMWTRDGKGDTNCMKRGGAGDFVQPSGRWPANIIHDGSEDVVKQFPKTNKQATCKTDDKSGWQTEFVGGKVKKSVVRKLYLDEQNGGSASRFFACCGEYRKEVEDRD